MDSRKSGLTNLEAVFGTLGAIGVTLGIVALVKEGRRGDQGPKGDPGPAVAVGTVMAWPLAAPPDRWVICDGQPRAAAMYPELYALFSSRGFPYGGSDGSDTFGIPDYRGLFLRGVEDPYGGQGTASPNPPRDPDGGSRKVGSSQAASVESHPHGINLTTDPGTSHGHKLELAMRGVMNEGIPRGAGGDFRTDWSIQRGDAKASQKVVAGEGAEAQGPGHHQHTVVGNTASYGGKETRPTNVAVNWIIYGGEKPQPRENQAAPATAPYKKEKEQKAEPTMPAAR